LIIAPSDSRSGDPDQRREALAWLRGRFARFGFHAMIVDGTQDPQESIDRATERVVSGDTVLVHASGRLFGREALAFGEVGSLPLGALTSALAARSPGHVSIVLELTHEEEPDDALLAAEILGAAVDSLGAKAHRYPVLAAVRPLGMAVDRIAFTRLALPPASEDAGPPPTETLVASMYDAASADSESRSVAQSFTFSRGAPSMAPPPPNTGYEARAYDGPALAAAPAIDGVVSVPASASDAPSGAPEASLHSQIAEATDQRDWARALELRRHRLHMLPSPRQKGRELVAIARILQVELGDAEGALEALEMARAMSPRPVNVLLALQRGYQKLGRWSQVLEVTGALAAITDSAVERSGMFVACARIALDRFGDRDRAVDWFAAAVDANPTNAEALAALGQLCPVPAPGGPQPAARPEPNARLEPTPPPASAVRPIEPAAPPEMDLGAREREAERLFAQGADTK